MFPELLTVKLLQDQILLEKDDCRSSFFFLHGWKSTLYLSVNKFTTRAANVTDLKLVRLVTRALCTIFVQFNH